MNQNYSINKDKLTLLKLKLILECGKLTHILGFSVEPEKEIKGFYIKNYKSSYVMDNNYGLVRENNELLHKYEYDTILLSPLVLEINKLLNDDFSTISKINEEIAGEKEKKYFQEVLSCIKVKEKQIGE